jgi:plasmid stabilization system protein ParE
MDFQIVWTERALAELEAVVRQVAADDMAAAAKLRLELLGSVEVLRRFPSIGPVYEKDLTGRAREILCQRYRVFYRVQEASNRVEILTVWHGSRKEPNL